MTTEARRDHRIQDLILVSEPWQVFDGSIQQPILVHRWRVPHGHALAEPPIRSDESPVRPAPARIVLRVKGLCRHWPRREEVRPTRQHQIARRRRLVTVVDLDRILTLPCPMPARVCLASTARQKAAYGVTRPRPAEIERASQLASEIHEPLRHAGACRRSEE